MAGMGPPPDPESRKSKAGAGRPGGFRFLPVDGRTEPPPKLPAAPRKGRRWLKETRDTWQLWWTSPQALEWIEADLPLLIRLARLLDAHLRDPDELQIIKEMRQLEDRMTLSPLTRFRARIIVDRSLSAPPDEDTDDPGRRDGVGRPGPGEDPRLRLVQ